MASPVANLLQPSDAEDSSRAFEIPKTKFPFPQHSHNDQLHRENRADSDATLLDNDKPDEEPALQSTTSQKDSLPQRPAVLDRRYGTEAPGPVGARPATLISHQTSGADPRSHSPLRRSSSSMSDSSDTSTDDDGAEVDIFSRRTQPGHRNLAQHELNRTRMRPWHQDKERRQDRPLAGQLNVETEKFRSKGKVTNDGRLNVKIHDTAESGYLAKALGSALASHLQANGEKSHKDAAELRARWVANKDKVRPPKMNILIMVIGSRGDIQPFLKIGRILQDQYGHRVRIATHPAFKKFVEDEIGLEFFSIGGDPAELMAFMVKNPGLIPKFGTLTSGEVGRRRDAMFEMFNGFWRACVNTTDDEHDLANLKLLGSKRPFVADAIIANPVAFAPIHCAEKLSIPLHLIFTFPMTPTKDFPSPLANIKSSNVDREYSNYMTYPLVDLMQWQGLGDLINRFRVKTLGLEPVSTLWAPGQLTRLRVPMTYLWSPGLVPKPEDWGPEVDIAGYVFLDLASSYTPPDDLVKFLERPEDDQRPLIYIGFGSISGIDDTKGFCQLIFDAVKKANVRAVVCRGWGGMGDGLDVPDTVYLIDNVPHDWLFPQLDAVVHHGGAGTTAAGLKLGLPTMIVPFFGDQPFWAQMIVRAGAGAKNVYPLKKLNVDRFAQGITECLEPEAKKSAQAIAKSIEKEGDGAENAVDSFHAQLELSGKHSMRCSVFEDRVSVWRVKHTGHKLSALAADLLVENKQVKWADLHLVKHKKWNDFQGPGEPITGAGGVLVGSFQEAFHGFSSIDDSIKADMKKVRRHRQKSRAGLGSDPDRHHGDGETGSREGIQINMTGEAAPVKIRNSGRNNLINHPEGERQAVRRIDTGSTLDESAPVVLVRDISKGVGHSFKALMLLPLDLLDAITLGFRNAPRLYGDQTVRAPPSRIKGFRQGVRIAGEEFFFGLYDGATGLVSIPYSDWHVSGGASLPKGVGKGVGGFVLKPIAGTLGLLSYPSKGAYAALRRMFRDTEWSERWIRRVRIAQGAYEARDLRSTETKSREASAEIEQARSRALTRFTTNDRHTLDQARESEQKRKSSILRSIGVKSGQREEGTL